MGFTELKFRAVYWLVDKLDRQKKLHFMNFGYSDPANLHLLDSADETDRYCIQLYQHLAKLIDLKDKDIVEVGSGRGGGLAFIAKNYFPRSLKGVDLSKKAIAFSNIYHKENNLSFQFGDAQHLPMEKNSCDVVLNVESSHRYPDMHQFLLEVVRILKNGGHFLFTDFRYDYEWTDLHKLLKDTGMKIIFEADITNNVIEALKMDDKRRRDLVNELAPRYLQESMMNFSGVIGSETYNYFLNRKYVYKSYVLQKD